MDSAPSRNICSRFINGSCRFGPRCHYRHEWPSASSPQICRYFQKGGCWFGESCRFLHVYMPVVAAAVTDRRGSVPGLLSSRVSHTHPDRRGSEPALLRADVTYRQECSGSESTVNASNPQHNTGHLPADNKNEQSQAGTELVSVQNLEIAEGTQEASSESEPQEGGAAAAAAAVTSSNKSEEEMEAFMQSKNVICGICMETVYDKEDARDHVFGILPNCNHPFCLQCIATWRKTKDIGSDVVRACPQCRVRSAFYVPNKYWVEGQAKESIIAAFKKKFSKKRCCFYDRYGYCPFRMECLYQHVGRSNRIALPFRSNDDEDEDGLDILGFFFAMAFLGGDDDDSDDDIPFYLAEEHDF